MTKNSCEFSTLPHNNREEASRLQWMVLIGISIVSSPSAKVLESIGFVEMTDQSQHFHKDVAESAECNRKSVQGY